MYRRRFLGLATTTAAVPLAGCNSGTDTAPSTAGDDGDGRQATPAGDPVSDYESFFPILYTPSSDATMVELAFDRSIDPAVRAEDFDVSDVRGSITPRAVDTSEAADGRIVLDIGPQEVPRSFRRVSYTDDALLLADSSRPLAGRTIEVDTTSSTILESTAPEGDDGRIPHGANVALYTDAGSTNESITVHRVDGSSREVVQESRPGPGSRVVVLFTTVLSRDAEYEVTFQAEDGHTTRRFSTYDLGLDVAFDSDAYRATEPVTGTVSANTQEGRPVELALYDSERTVSQTTITLQGETAFDLGSVGAGEYKLVANDLLTGIYSQAVRTTVGR